MHILIAPNAFKHALDAAEAASSIQQGLAASRLSCTTQCFPIGDGGNGTCRLIVGNCRGTWINTTVKDPLHRPISASLGLIDDGRMAVIEMADASGLHLLNAEELDPLYADSYGTGELIRKALDEGAKHIVVGMGGSATVDGGSGLLAALGARFLDGAGREITDLPVGLQNLNRIDCTSLDKRLRDCRLTVLCDVANPLLGAHGAARIFGPQKGASPEMVLQLEAILSRYADVLHSETGIAVSDIASGGVAGGASAGLKAVVGAELVNGIQYFLELTQFEASLAHCDLVVTGEGSIDEQTLDGKGPYGVAKMAKARGIAVIGLAGRVPQESNVKLAEYFDALLAIGNGPSPLEEALRMTSANLSNVATQLGNLLARYPLR